MVGRHLDEHLALGAPLLFRRLNKLTLALPPGSPVRERLTKRALARAFEALAREDYEVVLLAYDPDAEITIIGDDARAVGFAEHYHGRQGYRDMMRTWRTAWARPSFTPQALIDFGDRFVVRVKLSGRGVSSGAEVAQIAGYVLDYADGLVVHMDIYWEWSACVEALGLHDGAVSAAAASRKPRVPSS